jgi:predicted permease
VRRLRGWLRRVAGVFASGRFERDLAAELNSHLQLHIDDNVRAGMTPDEARRQAVLGLGGIEVTKERYRDQLGIPFVDAWRQDLRYAFRVLGKRPLLLVATTLSIGIGAGLNISVYSVLKHVLLESLVTAPDADRLVWITPGISYPDYQDLRAMETPVDLAAMTMAKPTWRSSGPTMAIPAHVVSDNYFDVVGVRPVLGRTFHSRDRVAGEAAPVVLSFGFWQQRMGGDPAVVGRSMELNGWPYVVAGVLPRDFRSLAAMSPNVYVPIGPHIADALESRTAGYFDLIGRLRDGVTPAQATAGLRTAAGSLEARFPAENEGLARRLTAIPATGLHVLDAALPSHLAPAVAGIVYALAGLVLLIACANVAALLVARANERRHEIAIRIALGATRGRLVQQCVAESLVIGALGCAAGSAFWMWSAAIIRSAPAVVNAGISVVPSSLPLLYCVVLALVVTIACGVAPAWTANQIVPVSGLRSERAGSVFRRLSLQRGLVAGQVATCFVLLAAAFVLLSAFLRLRVADPAFDVAHTVAVEVRLPNTSRGAGFFALREALRAAPGVETITCDQSIAPPITFTERVHRATSPDDAGLATAIPRVGPQFFETMRIPLVRGRDLNDADFRRGPAAAVPVIVNDTFARRYLSGSDPLDEQLVLPGNREIGQPARTARIVGVARDSKATALNHDSVPVLYVPAESTFLVARVTGPAADATRALERAVAARHPGAAVTATPAADRLALALLPARVGALLMTALGAIGVVLAMTGLYGVVSYTASRRTFEIGLRMALGATKSVVVRTIVLDGLWLVACGCVAGGAAAFALARVIRLVLGADRTSLDAASFFGVIAVLLVVGGVSSLWPARRAAGVDPAIALRHD